MEDAVFSANNQWFHTLIQHPVFSALQEEYPDLSRSNCSKRTFSDESFQVMKQSNGRNHHPDFTEMSVIEQSAAVTDDGSEYEGETAVIGLYNSPFKIDTSSPVPYELMAVSENQLFIVVGKVIRTLNLKEVKKAVQARQAGMPNVQEATSYQTLRIPALNFYPKSIKINGDGKIMAIVGDDTILIVRLPKLTRTTSEWRSYTLGGASFPARNTTIVKALWHPLSPQHSHILVLTSDNFLRMFDTQASLTIPEQTFYLLRDISTIGTKHAFAADKEATEAVSFCFGHAPAEEELNIDMSPTPDIWGLFSVYGLMKNGDVYAICPVMPLTCLLSYSQFDAFRSLHATLTTNHRSTSERNQHEFLSVLIDNAEPFPTPSPYPKNDELPRYMIIHGGVWRKRTPAPQGPFLFRPSPPDLNSEFTRASDIAVLNCKPLNVIVIAWENGKLDLCLEVDKIEPKWGYMVSNKAGKSFQVTGGGNDLPALIVYETIDLGLLSTFGDSEFHDQDAQNLIIPNSMSVVADPLYRDTFYVYHSAGVHSIDIYPWLNSLNKLSMDLLDVSEDEFDKGLEDFIQSGTRSDVGWIVSTMPLRESFANPVIGSVVITDSYIGYSLFILTYTLNLVPIELCLRNQVNFESQPPGIAPTDMYMSLLGEPFTVHRTLQNTISRMKQPILVPANVNENSSGGVSAPQLKFFGQCVERLRSEAKVATAAAHSVIERLNLQRQELERQVSKIKDISKRIAEQSNRKVQTHEQLENIQRTQEQITLRADTILQILMDLHEPNLSIYEKHYYEWLKEKEKLKIKFVHALSGMRKKIPQIVAEYQAVAGRSHRAATELTMPGEHDKKIRCVLHQQAKDIKEIQEKLNTLQFTLETI